MQAAHMFSLLMPNLCLCFPKVNAKMPRESKGIKNKKRKKRGLGSKIILNPLRQVMLHVFVHQERNPSGRHNANHTRN